MKVYFLLSTSYFSYQSITNTSTTYSHLVLVLDGLGIDSVRSSIYETCYTIKYFAPSSFDILKSSVSCRRLANTYIYAKCRSKAIRRKATETIHPVLSSRRTNDWTSESFHNVKKYLGNQGTSTIICRKSGAKDPDKRPFVILAFIFSSIRVNLPCRNIIHFCFSKYTALSNSSYSIFSYYTINTWCSHDIG